MKTHKQKKKKTGLLLSNKVKPVKAKRKRNVENKRALKKRAMRLAGSGRKKRNFVGVTQLNKLKHHYLGLEGKSASSTSVSKQSVTRHTEPCYTAKSKSKGSCQGVSRRSLVRRRSSEPAIEGGRHSAKSAVSGNKGLLNSSHVKPSQNSEKQLMKSKLRYVSPMASLSSTKKKKETHSPKRQPLKKNRRLAGTSDTEEEEEMSDGAQDKLGYPYVFHSPQERNSKAWESQLSDAESQHSTESSNSETWNAENAFSLENESEESSSSTLNFNVDKNGGYYEDLSDSSSEDARCKGRKNMRSVKAKSIESGEEVEEEDEDSSDEEVEEEDEDSNDDVEEEEEEGEEENDEEEEEVEISDEGEETKMYTYHEHSTGSVILVVDHPASFAIHGKALIRVISGSVCILGFEISSSDMRSYPLYSYQALCSLQVKTKGSEKKDILHYEKMQSTLLKYARYEVVGEVIRRCRSSSVVFVLQQHQITPAVDFACSYFSQISAFHDLPANAKVTMKHKGFAVTHEDAYTFKETKCYEALAEGLCVAVRELALNKEYGSRVLVYGKKGIGKSTCLRYLINRVLSCACPKVMYLDCDPGQTEFTPPGCFSLTEVTHPLLGPPFTHQKRPVKTVFFGSVGIEDFHHFCRCMESLADCYFQNFPQVPLFINTFGWMKDLGKECQDFMKKVLDPTFIVSLHETTDEESMRRSPEPCFNTGKVFIDLPVIHGVGTCLPAAVRRGLAVLAYLGRCQPYYEAVRHLNGLVPYSVKAEDVVLHFVHHEVDPPDLLDAMNGSFVALCHVEDESKILKCQDCSLPKKLADDGDFSTCLGFGFVRAIDQENGLLYIVTPEPVDVLQKVNAIVKGHVKMPDEVFLNQGICHEPLPFVRQLLRKKSHCSKTICVQK